jgi:hypothetical protein
MKLIIKEYLSLLKESKELDSLIPELLLSMGHEVISKAKIGVRQYGVDVASIGVDEDGIKKVFIFTIKEGDLKRSDWDNTSPQAVRPSLEEILDVYILTHLSKIYNDIPKKIIVATGGDLEQTVHQNWSGYTKKNSKPNEIEFDFWGGDKLSLLIEQYIFNEHIIPKNLRSSFRKTLALIGDVDYDLRDYFEYLYEILFKNTLETKSDKEILKALRLVYLSLNILIYWTKNEENLKPALLASERTLLNVYGFLSTNNFLEKKKFKEVFYKVYEKHILVSGEYSKKIYPLIVVENGLSYRGADFLQESLTLFEQLGILASYGSLYHSSAYIDKTQDEFDYSEYRAIKEHLMLMVKNHKGLYNPVYDEHIIDISLAIHLLELWNEIGFIDKWIDSLISHIQFAYYQGNYFPIDTNNFEDLVECNLGDSKEIKEYIRTSTLIPTIAFWCVKLGLIENYKYLYKVANDIYEDTSLQVWFPDKNVEEYLYKTKASVESGYVFAPIKIKKEIGQYSEVIEKILKTNAFINLKNKEMPILYFISSRHFKMPMFPHFLIDNEILLAGESIK